MSAVIPSIDAGLAQLQALTKYIDQGSENATFVFYSSTKPANTTLAADESKRLVTMTLPKPCFKKLNADSIELQQTDAAIVLRNGIAIFARLFSAAGKVVADFEVGIHITLNNPTLVAGSTLMLNSIVLKPTLQ